MIYLWNIWKGLLIVHGLTEFVLNVVEPVRRILSVDSLSVSTVMPPAISPRIPPPPVSPRPLDCPPPSTTPRIEIEPPPLTPPSFHITPPVDIILPPIEAPNVPHTPEKCQLVPPVLEIGSKVSFFLLIIY